MKHHRRRRQHRRAQRVNRSHHLHPGNRVKRLAVVNGTYAAQVVIRVTTTKPPLGKQIAEI